MTEITTEVLLSVVIIVLTVLAIIVFIVSGAGTIFYGIFVLAVIVMFYTWHRISSLPPETQMVAKVSYTRKVKKASTKRRPRRKRS